MFIQMRNECRSSLAEPPIDGFPLRFRLPDGTTIMRTFTSEMDIQDIISNSDLSTELNLIISVLHSFTSGGFNRT